MEITGRLTADAEVATVKTDKKVVRFTVAVNDSYRMGEERREITNYFECSYFRNECIAEYLKKGGIVQVFGRVGVRAYIAKDGEAKGALTCHVSEIKLFGGTPKAEKAEGSTAVLQVATADKEDDLPF
ncbi:single-stranded DNA-binding protein [Pedobacter sp. LMG 31464]|uniref:Single-stranded DNA-binding protein n=1 Tax=Pedobacter planticolens TaxID=2679964 RepID=A0A923E1A1_9SPHI|nr:single-stranded DNA-binding protein [Pedobacter planticolens]MBB2145734.1 single-stranded DNA-binding protein [Pedobacter planticolens]